MRTVDANTKKQQQSPVEKPETKKSVKEDPQSAPIKQESPKKEAPKKVPTPKEVFEVQEVAHNDQESEYESYYCESGVEGENKSHNQSSSMII